MSCMPEVSLHRNDELSLRSGRHCDRAGQTRRDGDHLKKDDSACASVACLERRRKCAR